MWAILKHSGTIPALKEQLYSISKGFYKKHLRSWRILIGILKGPADLPGLSSKISCLTSLEVIRDRYRVLVWGWLMQSWWDFLEVERLIELASLWPTLIK